MLYYRIISNTFHSLLLHYLIFSLSILLIMNSIAAMKLAEFASKSFIQKAIANPKRPNSVLSFFFGVDFDDINENYKDSLRNGNIIMDSMSDLWYKGGPDYDKLCQPFADVVRLAGKRQLNWNNESIDELMAQVLLCDQLSRNIFRGTEEAFAYDETALDIAKDLVHKAMTKSPSNIGEFYPPYLGFLVTPLMHSESIDSHDEAIKLIAFAKESAPQMTFYWDYQLQFELDHKSVLDRFGRYPHRNKAFGRINTSEELEWLADTDKLPGWAKSQ